MAANLSNGRVFTVCKRTFNYLTCFRDDNEKRDFVLGGVAAGVSSAFSSPIGGLIFTLEEVASSWCLKLLYRTLVASAIGTFLTGTLHNIVNGVITKSTYIGIFNFGKLEDFDFQYYELPIFGLMGVAGGITGSLFISIYATCNTFRQQYIKCKLAKVAEAAIICMVTVTIAAVMIYTSHDCRSHSLQQIEYPVKVCFTLILNIFLRILHFNFSIFQNIFRCYVIKKPHISNL